MKYFIILILMLFLNCSHTYKIVIGAMKDCKTAANFMENSEYHNKCKCVDSVGGYWIIKCRGRK